MAEGTLVQLTIPPRKADSDSKEFHAFVANSTNTIGSNEKFPSNKKFYAWGSIEKWLKDNDVPIVYDQYINTAGLWRIGRDLFFNHVNIINKLNEKSFMKKWERMFPEYRIHGLSTPGHGDGAMHPVKEGLIISIHSAERYKDTFPDWEVITVENSWKQVEPFLKMKNKNQN